MKAVPFPTDAERYEATINDWIGAAGNYRQERDCALATCERLTAENERLRAALYEIVRMGEFPDEYSAYSASRTAEDALNQQSTRKE